VIILMAMLSHNRTRFTRAIKPPRDESPVKSG
jgi:hypothetical protein